jgi:hypothetical protein
MKITPNDRERTHEILQGLFGGHRPPKVIGWSRKAESARFDTFWRLWNAMRLGDVVIVLKGTNTLMGCVVITSPPYELSPANQEVDWFDYRRNAELLLDLGKNGHSCGSQTGRNTIIGTEAEGARAIADEVYDQFLQTDQIQSRYDEILKEVQTLNPGTLTKIDSLLKQFHQIILCGPPGTGKTHLARYFAEKHLGLPNGQPTSGGYFNIVQFHPAYNYEDFVRGIQVTTESSGSGGTLVSYRTVDRVLAKMARAAKEAEEKDNFVLIIDEINRANLPSVMGELIYALEYRGSPVLTPYCTEGTDAGEVQIPHKLYIIGTMNTADRSIGHLDYALRRRFVFIPVLPDRGALEGFFSSIDTLREDKILELFDSVSALFEKSTERGYLSPDFHKDDVQVGHTYFMAKTCDELAAKFAYQVYPLLREYYKDGVLVERDGELQMPLKGLKIERGLPDTIRIHIVEQSQALFDAICKWCNDSHQEDVSSANTGQDSGADEETEASPAEGEPGAVSEEKHSGNGEASQ